MAPDPGLDDVEVGLGGDPPCRGGSGTDAESRGGAALPSPLALVLGAEDLIRTKSVEEAEMGLRETGALGAIRVAAVRSILANLYD